MKFRHAGLAVVVLGWAALAHAQAPLQLQISGGLVTLHADNVPVRTILAEWSRLGGAQVVGGDRVTGAPLTLDLERVPERQALDIVLRGVSGYMLAAREPGAAGASMYDRIMILPTSVAPRNPAPAAAAPILPGAAGIVRPVIPRQVDDAAENEADIINQNTADGVPLGRPVIGPVTMPRPVMPGAMPGAVPIAAPVFVPPVTISPDDDQPQLPAQPARGVVPTPANPFGLPAGSSTRPGVIMPVPPQQPGAPRTPPEN
ncbi:MAG TPA: hypothetical protein VN654_07655 [Vicinamibacterales bacterium]|nr:hypothetical protein [Vicinamibacterales bacterium]